ncbi:exodeoxyribonuclease III [Dietzia sp.]|uniref:exodeoxyribonuclease III n=1 Tax=Dietzia sp. TaxID=1871616 RepID=UPI002FD8C1DF
MPQNAHSPLSLATWNVNSIRARIDRVVDWIERSDVDVLAMQETKCKDSQFPFERFEKIGYEVAHFGLNQWNGVAIASRVGLDDVERAFPGMPGFAKDPEAEQAQEARAISAVCGGVRVWSLYVPNGRELTDRHYPYKLEWLDRLRSYAQKQLADDAGVRLAMVGDWNVAPLDEDVWDMEFFEGKTHVSAPEREAFDAFEAAGYKEITRGFTPGPGVYTYWDYTQLRFPKKQGMRIDFQVVSPALAERAAGAEIDRDERKGNGASDHAPVIVRFE